MNSGISLTNSSSYMLIIMKLEISLETPLFIVRLSIWRSNTTDNISKLNKISCSSLIYSSKKMLLMNSPSSKILCCSKNLKILFIWQWIYQFRILEIIQIERRCWKHNLTTDLLTVKVNKASYNWAQGWMRLVENKAENASYKNVWEIQRFLEKASSFIFIFMSNIIIFIVVRCRTNLDLIHSLQQVHQQIVTEPLGGPGRASGAHVSRYGSLCS